MSDHRTLLRSGRFHRRRLLIAFALLLSGLLTLGIGGPLLLRARPDFVAGAADRVRGIVGPEPVAAVEDAYYRAADWYNRQRYRLTGQADAWQLNAPVETSPTPPPVTPVATDVALPTATATPAPTPAITATVTATAGGASPVDADLRSRPPRPTPTPTPTLESLPIVSPIITGTKLAGEGVWRGLATAGQPPDEPPLLWQTILRPDPERPFAQVALTAMDLSRSRLHIVVGTNEPVSEAPPRGLRTGVIPAETVASGRLLAAWNGGFRATHGHYGMMTDGVTWLPPLDGMQTVAVDATGRLQMGAWGRGIGPSPAWLAWRQNNPPLIEDGVANPDVIKLANTIRWGASIDGAVFIWRSGMGLTAGRRWLIYAAGNSLSVETLTRGLQAAGAADAMQLDVNATYERFVTFEARPQPVQEAGKEVKLPLTAVKLIDQMSGGPTQFLVAHDRDFFYLTYRPPGERRRTPARAQDAE